MAATPYQGHSELSATKAAAENPDSVCAADRATMVEDPETGEAAEEPAPAPEPEPEPEPTP